MGSFNVGCVISNLSIPEGADRIGYVLLSPKKDVLAKSGFYLPEPPKTLKFYANDDYTPFFPPIYGRYGDYGQLVEIEDTPTARLFAEIFRRKPEDIIKAMNHRRDFYTRYNDLAALYAPEGFLETLDKNPDIETTLVSLGFTKTDDGFVFAARQPLTLAETETEGWRGAKKKGWTLKSEFATYFSNVPLTKVEQLMSHFSYHTGLYPGFAREDWWAIHTLRNLTHTFFIDRVYRGMVEDQNRDRYDEKSRLKTISDVDFFIQGFDPEASPTREGSEEFFFRDSLDFPRDKFPLLRPLVGTGAFEELIRLEDVLESVNRQWGPSFSGEQFGNDHASLRLNEITTAILEERIAEYDDDDFDDYEDDEDE